MFYKKVSIQQSSALFVLLTLLSVPAVSFAYFGPIDTFLVNVSGFINGVLVPLIFTVALAFFLYGMFKYFIQGGDSDDSRETGKQLMIYAVVGFVAMVSIWGVVNLVAGGLGFSADSNINNIPTGPGPK